MSVVKRLIEVELGMTGKSIISSENDEHRMEKWLDKWFKKNNLKRNGVTLYTKRRR